MQRLSNGFIFLCLSLSEKMQTHHVIDLFGFTLLLVFFFSLRNEDSYILLSLPGHGTTDDLFEVSPGSTYKKIGKLRQEREKVKGNLRRDYCCGQLELNPAEDL